jgi:dTDP-4-amino-4,6-dideoxygalactose transaminase
MNPHQVTKDFEREIAQYTGAPYAVAVNSCTSALTLAVAWHLRDEAEGQGWSGAWDRYGVERICVEIPSRTYVSVPQAIIHAGGMPTFREEKWSGAYRLSPLPVWDCARYFTSDMYHGPRMEGVPFRCGWTLAREGVMLCVSFHASKTLGLEQGGAILHDNPEADAWLRKARFDGRTEGVAPKDDRFDMVGWHCYLNPSTAAQGILKLHSLPKHNEPLENDDYPALDQMDIFK